MDFNKLIKRDFVGNWIDGLHFKSADVTNEVEKNKFVLVQKGACAALATVAQKTHEIAFHSIIALTSLLALPFAFKSSVRHYIGNNGHLIYKFFKNLVTLQFFSTDRFNGYMACLNKPK